MEYIKLANIVRIIPGYAIPSNCMTGRGTPIIKITNIKADNTLDLQNTVRYNQPISSKLRKFILKSKDILVCMTGATIGKIARQIEVGENYIVNQRVAIIRPENPDDFDYVYYALTTSAFRRYVELVGYGAGQPNISGEAIGDFRLNYDSRQEKRKTIGGMLSQYDVLIENNNRRIRILEQMAENLYKEWFVRFRFPGHETAEFENGLPKGWNVKKIKNCVKRLPFNRLYKENELEPSGKIIVIDQSAKEYLGFHNNEPSHYADFSTPIILFGDHSCKFKLMCKNFSLGENVVPFCTCNISEINTFFLYYSIHKMISTEEYKRHWGRLVNMKIFIPPLDLQRSYAEKTVPWLKLIELLRSKNQNLIKQRDMLLPRLMSGKLEI